MGRACHSERPVAGRFGNARRADETFAQLGVVLPLAVLIEQTATRGGNFAQEPLRQLRVRAVLQRSQVCHLAVSGRVDHIRIGFKRLDTQ